MKVNKKLYNEDRFRKDFDEAMSIVNTEEALQWSKHPCTQALVSSLQGDMCGLIDMWLAGAYSDEQSTAATAQKEAKARGIAQAIEDVLEMIENISLKNLEEDY